MNKLLNPAVICFGGACFEMSRFISFKFKGKSRFGIICGVDGGYELRSISPKLKICNLKDLFSFANSKSKRISEISGILEKRSNPICRFKDLDEIGSAEFEARFKIKILMPFKPAEVWGAGVTYKREKLGDDVYSKSYFSPRPYLFFKATPARCAGPNENVGIRFDSLLSVPEPELVAFLNAEGKIIGYACGNDMGSRDIEKENILYLSQAKTYDNCFSLGPIFATPDEISPKTEIGCRVSREGEKIFESKTSLSMMARSPQEMADWLSRCNRLPLGAALSTGTGAAPPAEFALKGGDKVEVWISGLGTLRNTVAIAGDKSKEV